MGKLKTRIEQYRQAFRIHGGMFHTCAAALAVKLSRVKIPTKRLRLRIYRTLYGKKYPELNENELEQPLSSFPSLNALFTRGVRPEFRPIAEATDQYLCPCDGKVQDVGTITSDATMVVKGVDYRIDSLLAQIDARPFVGGSFAIVFLSPSDCHRIFSPQDGHILEAVHVPGSRLLVHPPFQRKEFPVFTLNERMILRMATPLGACALVLVAGWGVGNITLPGDTSFRPRPKQMSRKLFTPPLAVKRGEWLATFELGSTAILLLEPSERIAPNIVKDALVQYGQPVFSIIS